MRARAAIAAAAVGVACLGAAEARASRVAVFALEARAVAPSAASRATRAVVDTLEGLGGVEVVDPEAGRARLGVDPTEQARACRYDVFCLVELGELLQTTHVLVGHLARPAPTSDDADEGLQLELVAIDVAKATVVEILRWRVPDLDPDAVTDAASAAARRFFGPKDVEVRLDLEPPSAEVRFYGEPVERPEDGGPFRYWSGTYHAEVLAEGYTPLRVRVRLAPGPGATRVPLSLEPDPLYVAEKKRPVEVFDTGSRRLGSGVTAQTAGAAEATEAPAPAYATPWPWLAVGGGIGLSVLGAVLAARAQSDYDALSAEARYSPGVTLPADLAMRDRDQQRTQHRIGTGAVLGGVAVVVAAGAWMLFDGLRGEPEPARAEREPRPARPGPAARRAARRLALELRP